MGVECLPHRALLAVQLSLHVPFGISGRFPLRRVNSPRVRFWNDSPGGQLAVGWAFTLLARENRALVRSLTAPLARRIGRDPGSQGVSHCAA